MKRNVLYRNAVSGVEGTCSEEEFLELCKNEACRNKLLVVKYSDEPRTPPEAVKPDGRGVPLRSPNADKTQSV